MKYIQILFKFIFIVSISLHTIQADSNNTTISINDVTNNEGNSGATYFVFTISLSNVSTSNISVTYTVTNGSTNSVDLGISTGTATINAGSRSTTISIPVNGDSTIEEDEIFYVNLSNPVGATISNALGIGTILNDDVQPDKTLSINDTVHMEGNSEITDFNFVISMTSTSTETVSVTYTVAHGTTDSTDLGSVTKTATINVGTLSTTISIPVNGDTTAEEDEKFYVNLSNPVGATIADAQGIGTITNDDEEAPWYTVRDVDTDSKQYSHIDENSSVLIDNSGDNDINLDSVTITEGSEKVTFRFEEEAENDMTDESIDEACKPVTYTAYIDMHENGTIQTGYLRASSFCDNMQSDPTVKDNTVLPVDTTTVLRRPSENEKESYQNTNIVIISDVSIDGNITLGGL